MYANQEMEQLDIDEMRKLQLERLKRTVSWAAEKSLFYQRKFDDEGISEPELNELSDITKLPFTTNKELMETPGSEFLTLPFSSISRVALWEHPQYAVHYYTQNDIAANVEMVSRALAAAGITRASVVGLLGDMADSGLMDTQYALEMLGATAIPLSTEYERAIMLLGATSTDVLVGSARRLLRFVIQSQADGKDIADYPVKKIICLTEGLQNPLRAHIERRTNTVVYNLYSSSVFGALGMLYQCESHVGQHIAEDHYYPEIVAFGSDEIITSTSVMGELVLTTLTSEGMPIIRGRTGQPVMMIDTPCPCGRKLMRLNTPTAAFAR